GRDFLFIHDKDFCIPAPSHWSLRLPVIRSIPPLNAFCASSICMYLYQRCPAVARKCLSESLVVVVRMKKCHEGFGIGRILDLYCLQGGFMNGYVHNLFLFHS
ncbi:hypothetical protein CEXT_578831, partial [Caerostris extrusa]